MTKDREQRVAALEFPIPFVLANGELSWTEAKWGFDRGLISAEDLIGMACDRFNDSAGAPDDLVVRLCMASPTEVSEVESALQSLCDREPAGVAPKDKWIRIALRWVTQNWKTYRNFPGALEDLVIFFEYPDELHELNAAVAGMAGEVRDPARDYTKYDNNFLKLATKYL